MTTRAHWTSESGVIELFVFPGPTHRDVFSQYAVLTGFPTLPPLFSLGFHQSRFSYYVSVYNEWWWWGSSHFHFLIIVKLILMFMFGLVWFGLV